MKIKLKFLFSHFSVVSEKGKRQFPSGFLKLTSKGRKNVLPAIEHNDK